jgi:hypothetical protein
LCAIPSIEAQLLEFVILSVSRSGVARLARFDQSSSAIWRARLDLARERQGPLLDDAERRRRSQRPTVRPKCRPQS